MSIKTKFLLIISFLFLMTTRVKAQVLIPELIACYDMNEISGTRYDTTTNNLDLTDVNTVGSGIGLNGNAAVFIQGNNEYLLSTSQLFDFDITGHAIYAVVNHGTGTAKVVYSKDHGSVPGQRMLYDNGQMDFYLGPDSVTITGGPIDGQWAHLFAWADAGVMYGQIGTGSVVTSTTTYSPNNYNFMVGAYTDAAVYYDGYIDTFAVFSDAFNSDTRSWLYNLGSGRTCSEIITGESDSETETVYFLDLPSGGVGSLEMKISAGEMIAALGIALVVMLLAYKQLSEMAKGSKPK